MASNPRKQAFKRIVVLSDGTWQTLETKVATNVREIAMGIEYEDNVGVQQVVHYDPGLGTNGGIDKMMGGTVGAGIDKNITQLYTFLALNYEPGDEIYMFGFSRGAYTVRSLAGLIYNAGLVRRDRIENVEEAMKQYRKKVHPDSQDAIQFRRENGDRPQIKLLACFDTVAALGLPTKFLSKFTNKKYEFHDDTLNANVENAIHCLSIDEKRDAYKPTMMNAHPDVGLAQLTQKWFWGDHSGIGGGETECAEAPKVTLRFMIEEIRRRKLGLSFNDSLIPEMIDIAAPIKPLEDSGGFTAWVQRLVGMHDRKIICIDDVHHDAIRRYHDVGTWRPGALKKFERQIKTVVFQ